VASQKKVRTWDVLDVDWEMTFSNMSTYEAVSNAPLRHPLTSSFVAAPYPPCVTSSEYSADWDTDREPECLKLWMKVQSLNPGFQKFRTISGGKDPLQARWKCWQPTVKTCRLKSPTCASVQLVIVVVVEQWLCRLDSNSLR